MCRQMRTRDALDRLPRRPAKPQLAPAARTRPPVPLGKEERLILVSYVAAGTSVAALSPHAIRCGALRLCASRRLLFLNLKSHHQGQKNAAAGYFRLLYSTSRPANTATSGRDCFSRAVGLPSYACAGLHLHRYVPCFTCGVCGHFVTLVFSSLIVSHEST